ncbi:MAG TPA: hypothetical protein DCG75_00915 [Bacteroidales bacterium]|jgi:gliding motility-associated-like protein|nr:hypothetical protein [Bacteroidales bacterium]
MARIKVFIGLLIILFSQKLIAQVDTISFRFEPDVSSYKINCIAQKITSVDTSDFNPTLTPTDTNYTFTWSGDGIILENGLPKVMYSFGAAGVYTFTLDVLHKPSGKLYEETKTFEIRDIIRVPNVFTPNDDGINDLFIVRANGITPLEITIFSRTGTVVFNTRSPIIVWDGKSSSGADLSEGIYFYVLKSEDPAVDAQQGFFHLYNKKP